MIKAGPISVAHPAFGFEPGRVYGYVGDGGSAVDHIAQTLLGAATSQLRTLLLIQGERDKDPIWTACLRLLDSETELRNLSLLAPCNGTGERYAEHADLVCVSGYDKWVATRIATGYSVPVVTVAMPGMTSVIAVGREEIRLPDGTTVKASRTSNNEADPMAD
jgi:hypothetical protein